MEEQALQSCRAELKDLCKKHLKKKVEKSLAIDEKLHGGHLYFVEQTNLCASAKKDCSSAVENIEESAGITYLVFVKGAVSNNKKAWSKLERVINEVSKLERTQELRVGYETLLLIAKQITKITEQEERGTVLKIVQENIDLLVKVLNTTMESSHFVIRNVIKSIVKELASLEEIKILEHREWSVQHKTDIILSMKNIRVSAKPSDIDLLNDKNCGDKITKLLLLSDHKEYAKLLAAADFNSVGTRNIRILAKRVADGVRSDIFRTLVEERSHNCVYFSDSHTVLPEYVIKECSTLSNENLRVEYFEALMKDQSSIENRLELIQNWIKYNQILLTKENQKRVRVLFQLLVKIAKYKIISKYEYLVENQIEETETTRKVQQIKNIINTVLEMAEGSNCCRVLQGLHLLKILVDKKETAKYVDQGRYIASVLTALSDTHKEVREIAAQFPIDMSLDQVKSALQSKRNNDLYGITLLFTSKLTPSNISEMIKYLLERIQQSDISTELHKDIYVLWNIFNSLPTDKVLLEGNRLNPVHLVEAKKRKAAGLCKLDIRESYKVDVDYRIEEVYKDYILPQFKKSLEILQTREIYLSEHTGGELDIKKENHQNTEYLLNWYVVRECIVFITVYSITARDLSCLNVLIDGLLTVGGHLGVIMTGSDAVKTILIFNDISEDTVSCARFLLDQIRTRHLKNIRRDGGIPYAFKALTGSESNLKEKPSTHYLMKECIGKSFELIKNKMHLEPIRNNLGLIFSGYLISELDLRTDTHSLSEPEIADTKYLIHYINILKSISSDGIFKYDLRLYEPSLFLLSGILICHSNWKVRNTALMLYTALIKKMCKETLNSREVVKYSKVSVHPRSRKVLFDCLTYFSKKSDSDGIFSCLVFFCRVNGLSDPEEALILEIQKNTHCKRTLQKIEQTLYRKPTEKTDIVLSSHKVVPIYIKDLLSKYNEPEITRNCSSRCMRKESALLDIIGSEDEYIRSYAVNKICPNRSYEYALHHFLKCVPCKNCLIERLSESEKNVPENEQFPADQENLFRDIKYELSILYTLS